MQRILALVVSGARIGSAVEKELEHGQISCLGGNAHREIACKVDVRTFVEQERHRFNAAGLYCDAQRILL